MLKCSDGFIFVHPGGALGVGLVGSALPQSDLLCVEGAKSWDVQGALAVWDHRVFLVLGPALVSLSKCPSWKTHFTAAGGGLVAVIPVLLSWGLFVLEAPLIDFC